MFFVTTSIVLLELIGGTGLDDLGVRVDLRRVARPHVVVTSPSMILDIPLGRVVHELSLLGVAPVRTLTLVVREPRRRRCSVRVLGVSLEPDRVPSVSPSCPSTPALDRPRPAVGLRNLASSACLLSRRRRSVSRSSRSTAAGPSGSSGSTCATNDRRPEGWGADRLGVPCLDDLLPELVPNAGPKTESTCPTSSLQGQGSPPSLAWPTGHDGRPHDDQRPAQLPHPPHLPPLFPLLRQPGQVPDAALRRGDARRGLETRVRADPGTLNSSSIPADPADPDNMRYV